MNWIYAIIAWLVVSPVVAIVVGKVLSGSNYADDVTVIEHSGCAVLEVRDGASPVAVLLPTSSRTETGAVTNRRNVKMVHVSLHGEGAEGVAAVLRAAHSTDHRVDVRIVAYTDVASNAVRLVGVSVHGGGASVQLAESIPCVAAH